MNKNNYREVEAKFYVEDLAGLEKRLKAAGAKLVQAKTHEYNIRYDSPDGELSKKSQVLRLRQDNEAKITFKGNNVDDEGAVSREEIEFSVGDFEAAKKLLEALGYEVFAIYEKYRTTYALDGLLWMLDETPIGKLAEIEGQSGRQIRAAAEKLGIDWETRLMLGYLDIFERIKEKLELDFRDLTFENFEGIEVGDGLLGKD